jgi:hypothetical protein
MVLARAGHDARFSVVVGKRIIETEFDDPFAAVGRWGVRRGAGQAGLLRLLRPQFVRSAGSDPCLPLVDRRLSYSCEVQSA